MRHGSALGFAGWKPEEETHTHIKEELLNRIQISLASRAAEEIFLNIQMDGVTGDLRSATSIATYMVGAYGMDNSFYSHMTFGMEGLAAPDIKARVEAILKEQFRQVKQLLENNKEALIAIAEALILRNELTDIDVDEILARVEAEYPLQVRAKLNSAPLAYRARGRSRNRAPGHGAMGIATATARRLRSRQSRSSCRLQRSRPSRRPPDPDHRKRRAERTGAIADWKGINEVRPEDGGARIDLLSSLLHSMCPPRRLRCHPLLALFPRPKPVRAARPGSSRTPLPAAVRRRRSRVDRAGDLIGEDIAVARLPGAAADQQRRAPGRLAERQRFGVAQPFRQQPRRDGERLRVAKRAGECDDMLVRIAGGLQRRIGAGAKQLGVVAPERQRAVRQVQLDPAVVL